MIVPRKVYTYEQLKEMGLEKAREGFADLDIFTGENKLYLMERKKDAIAWELYSQFKKTNSRE